MGVLHKELLREEAKIAKEINSRLEAALSGKALLKNVQNETSSCSPKPPKEVVRLFEAALEKELKNLRKSHPAAQVTVKLRYSQDKKGQWLAKPNVTCGLKLKTFGGGSYKVRKGDTLWQIAKNTYGSGGLWTEIAAANKPLVSSKGDFILAGVTLKLPKLSLPVAECGIDMISPRAVAPKDSLKTARNVCVPPYTIDFNASKPTVRIINGPVVAWKVTTRLKGELLAVCDLLMNSGATLKSTGAAIEKDALGFVGGIEISSVGESSVTIGAKVGGTTWALKLTPSKPGQLTGSVSGKSVRFKSGRTVFSGKIGIEVTIQAMPKVRVQDIKGKLHEFWVDNGDLIKGTALVGAAVVVAVVAVGAVASPVPGDEVVAWGAAMQMMRVGMQTLKFAH